MTDTDTATQTEVGVMEGSIESASDYWIRCAKDYWTDEEQVHMLLRFIDEQARSDELMDYLTSEIKDEEAAKNFTDKPLTFKEAVQIVMDLAQEGIIDDPNLAHVQERQEKAVVMIADHFKFVNDFRAKTGNGNDNDNGRKPKKSKKKKHRK